MASRKKPAAAPAVDKSWKTDPFAMFRKPSEEAAASVADEPTSGSCADNADLIQSSSSPFGAMISTLNKETTVNDTTKPTAQEVAEAKAREKVAAKQAKLDAAAKAKADKEAANAAKAEAKAAAKADAEAAKIRKANETAEQKAAAKAEAKAAAKADAEAAKIRKANETAEQKAAAKAARDAAKAEAGTGEPAEGMSGALREKVSLGLYVKGKNGQLRTNDPIALALETVQVQDMVPLLLETMGIAENPYPHLNQGQQSMNLRNRLRGAIRKETKIENTDVVISLARLVEIRDAKFTPVAEKVAAKQDTAAETAEAEPATV